MVTALASRARHTERALAWYHDMGIRCCSEKEYLFWAEGIGSGYRLFCSEYCPEKEREKLVAKGLCPPLNPVATLGRKRCPVCGCHKSSADFYANRSTCDGLHWRCKQCESETKRRAREAKG